MIDDCFPKLQQEYIAQFESIGLQEQNLVALLPQMLNAWNDNFCIIKE